MFAVAGLAPLQIVFFIRLKQYGEQSVRRNWNRDQAAYDSDHKHRTQGVGKNFECDIHMHASFGRRITTLTYSVASVKRLDVLPTCLAVLWRLVVLSSGVVVISGVSIHSTRSFCLRFRGRNSAPRLCRRVHFMNSLRHFYAFLTNSMVDLRPRHRPEFPHDSLCRSNTGRNVRSRNTWFRARCGFDSA